jgi:hypothetical protein
MITHGPDCPGVVWGEHLTLCPGGADCQGALAERAAVAREGGPGRRPAVLGGECARCRRGGGAHETSCPKVIAVYHRAAIRACSEVLDGPIDLDTLAGDSVERAHIETAIEAALSIDLTDEHRGRWRTPRELAAIVERVMGERA